MTTQVMAPRRSAPKVGGQKPLPNQKLIYVADKLGLDGLKDMQGSTVNIFDTVALTTQTDRQTLSFFTQTTNKSRNFSNWQNGKFGAGEAMVIEEIAFFLVVATNADLSANTNAILSVAPLTFATETQYPNAEGFMVGGLMNLTIANQKVVKDFNTFELHPAFNQAATGLMSLDTATATNKFMGPTKIKLESPPVLPPNLSLSLTQEIPPTGTVPAFTFIMCVCGRFGSIFSGKVTL